MCRWVAHVKICAWRKRDPLDNSEYYVCNRPINRRTTTRGLEGYPGDAVWSDWDGEDCPNFQRTALVCDPEDKPRWIGDWDDAERFCKGHEEVAACEDPVRRAEMEKQLELEQQYQDWLKRERQAKLERERICHQSNRPIHRQRVSGFLNVPQRTLPDNTPPPWPPTQDPDTLYQIGMIQQRQEYMQWKNSLQSQAGRSQERLGPGNKQQSQPARSSTISNVIQAAAIHSLTEPAGAQPLSHQATTCYQPQPQQSFTPQNCRGFYSHRPQVYSGSGAQVAQDLWQNQQQPARSRTRDHSRHNSRKSSSAKSPSARIAKHAIDRQRRDQ